MLEKQRRWEERNSTTSERDQQAQSKLLSIALRARMKAWDDFLYSTRKVLEEKSACKHMFRRQVHSFPYPCTCFSSHPRTCPSVLLPPPPTHHAIVLLPPPLPALTKPPAPLVFTAGCPSCRRKTTRRRCCWRSCISYLTLTCTAPPWPRPLRSCRACSTRGSSQASGSPSPGCPASLPHASRLLSAASPAPAPSQRCPPITDQRFSGGFPTSGSAMPFESRSTTLQRFRPSFQTKPRPYHSPRICLHRRCPPCPSCW